jgi:hypothetical protein
MCQKKFENLPQIFRKYAQIFWKFWKCNKVWKCQKIFENDSKFIENFPKILNI